MSRASEKLINRVEPVEYSGAVNGVTIKYPFSHALRDTNQNYVMDLPTALKALSFIPQPFRQLT